MFTPLPVFLPSPEDEKEILDFIKDELEILGDRRARLHRQLRDYEKGYESVHEGPSDFPWPNSANPRVGVIQYHVDTIHALLMNVLKANELPFVCKSYDPSLKGILKPAEQFLQWAAGNDKEMDLWPSLEPAVLEMVQMGTSIVKGVYERTDERIRLIENIPTAKLSRNAAKIREKMNGKSKLSRADLMRGVKELSEVKVRTQEISREKVKLVHVPLADFWFPFGYMKLQDMPWVAERFRVYTDRQLKDTAKDLGWKKEAVEKVSNHWKQLDEERQEVGEGDKGSGLQTGILDVNTFFELWFEWELKSDPLEKITEGQEPRKVPSARYVLWYHAESQTIMGMTGHPNNNDIWPYFDFHYQKRKYHFLSRGLAAILQSDEQEINAIHKQRRDAATAANTVVGKARRNSGLDVENTTLWPMKVFFMDEPEKDLIWDVVGRELNIQSLIQEEDAVNKMIERKTGLTEFNMGRDMGNLSKGRASATAIMAQLRENLRRFSKVLDNCRVTLSAIGMHSLELYQQNSPLGKIFTVLGKDGEAIEEFFMLPQVPLRGRMAVVCTVSNETLNEEVRRQALLLTNNMMQAYYKQMIELVTTLSNPNAPPDIKAISMKVAKGATVLIEEILEAFGIRRRDELTLDPPKTFADLSPQARMELVKQMVNILKGEGAPVELIDTTQQPQPQAPAAAPGAPVPVPQALGPSGAGGPPAMQAPPPGMAPAPPLPPNS